MYAHSPKCHTWCSAGAQEESSAINLRPSAKDSSLRVRPNSPYCGVILPWAYPIGLLPCEEAALWWGLWPQLPFWCLLVPVICTQSAHAKYQISNT